MVGRPAKRAREVAFVTVTGLEDALDRPVAPGQVTKSIVGGT